MVLTWIIQSNLGKSGDVEALLDACEQEGQPASTVAAIPFSDALPDVPNDGPTLFYGATSFTANIHAKGAWRPGVFFDEAAFRYGACVKALGPLMLNADGEQTTLGALAGRELPDEHQLFLRPQRDDKAFAGGVMRMGKLREWVSKLDDDMMLTKDCEIIAAEPVDIAEEYRMFMVRGQPIAGSRYRVHHALSVSQEVPQEVMRFAADVATGYAPVDVFVMDIARLGDTLHVIEFNCFNSSGFYGSDKRAIVRAVSALFS